MTSKSMKEILSYVRKGDFAHPGEMDAIDMALQPILKKKSQSILDVGCGLGGTAHYVQQHGWGNVTGIDLDDGLIQYAQSHYPDISFVWGDILHAEELFQKKFDLIYSFTAFFCFLSQKQALKQMASVANIGTELVIFDYSRFAWEDYASPFPWSNTANYFHPIYMPQFKSWLRDFGWQLTHIIDISSYFEIWYTQLLRLFDEKREEILLRFEDDLLNKLVDGYHQLLMDIKAHKIGGIIVYAEKS